MDNLIIKGIRREDFPEVLKISKGQIGRMYFEDIGKEMEECLRGNYSGFVGILSREYVGYASWRKKVEVAYLETIVVKKNHQGKGIGGILLERVEQDVMDNYLGLINVVTDADALKTLNFYIKNGFQVSGYVDNEFLIDTGQAHLCKFLENSKKNG